MKPALADLFVALALLGQSLQVLENPLNGPRLPSPLSAEFGIQQVDFHGDVGRCVESLGKVLPRMNGKKRLLWGNHDDLDLGVYAKYFEKCMVSRSFGYKDLGCALLCTHFPVHPSSLLDRRYPGRCINVHGHTQENNVTFAGAREDPRYFNVSVESVDYTPVHHDALVRLARREAA